MEIFIDGGLFELLIAVAMGYMINFIFFRKYMLVIYSIVAITSSVALIFVRAGEYYYWLAGINIFNAALLVVLLWTVREKFPNEPLFDIKKLKSKFNWGKRSETMQANSEGRLAEKNSES